MTAATNAYAQVFNSPFADISARSQAQIGFGIALEKKAALADGDDQRLLKLALDNYLDVWDTAFRGERSVLGEEGRVAGAVAGGDAGRGGSEQIY